MKTINIILVFFASSIISIAQNNVSQQTTVNSVTLDNWCFQYKYDDRQRMTHRKVPGADWIYMVYDNRDRLVMSQDGEQRKKNQWIVTSYDELNRPVITALYSHGKTVSQPGMDSVIMENSLPTTNLEILTRTYYDDYSFLGQNSGSRTIGLVTGTMVRVLNAPAPYYLLSVNYYDDHNRVVRTVSRNYDGGTDIVSNTYDFSGKITSTRTEHSVNNIAWKKMINIQIEGNSMIRSAGSNNTGGGSSTQFIPSSTDGWTETVVAGTNTSRYFGLSDYDSDASPVSIDYGFYLNETQLHVYENGVKKYSVADGEASGDRLKISRTGRIIKYFKNEILVYTSTVQSSSALYVDISLISPNAMIFAPTISSAATSETILKLFEYDHAGRLIFTRHSVNGGDTILLSKNDYNEIGQLIHKGLHSIDNVRFRQDIDYRYNIRGWLTSNKGNLFEMSLLYNDSDAGLDNSKLYNGSISAMRWSHNLESNDIKQRGYIFRYDPMYRLTTATSKIYHSSWQNSNAFYESDVTYDLNGNIKSLRRSDELGSSMDLLNYDYGSGTKKSNQVRKITDSGTASGFVDVNLTNDDYSYDLNGNLVADMNKGITSISYNFLNLPTTVTKNTGESINYWYDATGNRLSQVVRNKTGSPRKVTDYHGEFVYENDTIRLVNHEEGRLVPDGKWTSAPQLLTFADMNNVSNFSPYSISKVTMVNETINGQTYLKIVSNQTSTSNPGLSTPGFLSPIVEVTPGKKYTLKVRGYTPDDAPVVLYVVGTGYEARDLVWPGPRLLEGASNEGWVELTFSVPKSMDRIRVGATWRSGVDVNDKFYVNTMELYEYNDVHGNVVFKKNGYTYEYHLKDHLGNVRMTFTTKDERDKSIVDFETSTSDFLNYNQSVRINSQVFDHTGVGPTYYSSRLNGTPKERYGVARSLSVIPGDTIKMEVFAKYLDPDSTITPSLNALLSSIANGTSPVGTIKDGSLTGGASALSIPLTVLSRSVENENDDAPRAYLNWVIFDRKYTVRDAGALQISTKAAEHGEDGEHEHLSKQIVIGQAGYIYIYLSNDNYALGNGIVDVYFDDFKVEHIKSPLVQSQDYYPFGLTFNEYSRENSTPNWHEYNGKEKQQELGVGWFDYGSRMYLPDIGRWNAIDPKAQKYANYSPYNYVLNNPVNAIDPDGEDAILIAFPDYKIQTPAGRVGGLGHAGVLLIDNKTGVTRYYEYGRYESDQGEVRRAIVSNVKIDKKTGQPTIESLNKVLKQVSKAGGHGGKIRGAYVKSDKFAEMKAYADEKYAERDDPNRKSYSLTSNNCGTFARDVIAQDDNVDNPRIFNPTPINIVDEYVEEGNAEIKYDPKSDKTTIGQGDEKDAKKKYGGENRISWTTFGFMLSNWMAANPNIQYTVK